MPGWGGHSADATREYWQGRADAQPLLTACALCGWSYQGDAAEARQKAAEHRSEAHPEIRPTRRRRAAGGFRQRLSDEDTAEIELERRRRARQIGIDLDE